MGKGEGASTTKAAAQTADAIPISNKRAGSKAVEDRGREVNSEAVSTIQSFFAAAVMSLRTALRESADTAGVKPVRLPFIVSDRRHHLHCRRSAPILLLSRYPSTTPLFFCLSFSVASLLKVPRFFLTRTRLVAPLCLLCSHQRVLHSHVLLG